MERSNDACRLSAVFAADVVGYSRLMQHDDQTTLRALTERRPLFAAHIEAVGGQVVNAHDDSVLVEFCSVVNAGQCTLNVQGVLEGRHISYRVVVNLGDIDCASTYGDEVDVATRRTTTRSRSTSSDQVLEVCEMESNHE
ncbi:hypothetical protein QTI33_33275 [Variovorax sp. J22P271]|uniref:hypothetical protein n=1 Tax=Variovorax davisae TaxID=3053515 RepID=UPI0025774D82|nr:hypothetical protein [Variovorax sp. J22P271]MDM0037047.1 hypothetical protein [Variovorax sp. J22P271]